MLPAGLIDENIELFANGEKLNALYNGNVVDFFELPKSIIMLFIDDMLKYPEKINCLYQLGLTDINQMVYKFAWCMYGGFDNQADFDTSKENFTSEYFNCGNRGGCLYEFKLCDSIKVGDCILTKRNIEIIKQIASGKADKNIADGLGISILTLHTHKKIIYEKLGIHCQTEATAFAFRNNLIQ